MVVRGLANEISYLPQLASLVPLPIPVPRYLGKPSPEYRWPFYGAPSFPVASLRVQGWTTPGAPRSLARSA
jgi:hypothetical protein